MRLYCKRREEDRIEFEIDSSGEMFIMIKNTIGDESPITSVILNNEDVLNLKKFILHILAFLLVR
jgi:hypothetical protein